MTAHRWVAMVTAGILLGGGMTRAATNGLDQAGDTAYDSGWTQGSNGGSGFGAWILTTTTEDAGQAGHFVGDSTSNGGGPATEFDDDINTNDRAWGLYANNGQTASAVRPLLDGPMMPGQTVEFYMDNGWVDGGAVGGGLQNAQGQNVFEVLYRSGVYEYVDAMGIQTSSVPFTDKGLKVSVTLTSYATYTGRIESLNPVQGFDFSGTLMNPSGGAVITQVRFFNFNAGEGGERDAFFNVLSLSPAPVPPAVPAPAISALSGDALELTVTWPATNMVRYGVQVSTNLVAGDWVDLPGATDLVAFDATIDQALPVDAPAAYYRLWQLP